MNKVMLIFVFILFNLELTFIYSDTLFPGQSSLRLYFGILAIFIFFSVQLLKERFNLYASYQFIFFYKIIIFYIVFIFLHNMLVSKINPFIALPNIIRAWILISISGFMIHRTFNKISQIYYLLLSASVIMAISSIIAILQYYDFRIGWDIRMMLGGLNNDLEVAKQVINNGRVMGLSWYAIPFSYSAATIIPINISLTYLTNRKRIKMFLWLIVSISILGLILNQTRGAIIGVLVGFIYISIYLNKKKILFILPILSIILITINIESIVTISNLVTSRFVEDNIASRGRFTLYTFSLLSSLSSPLGYSIGDNREVETLISNMDYANIIYKFSPHNQILTSTAKYGWVAIILIFLIYRKIIIVSKYLLNKMKYDRQYPLYVGISASFISYFINSMFHNAGLLSGHVMHWMMIFIFMQLYFITNKLSGVLDNKYLFRKI
jgi:hypothetical protein